jgi:hypothetical protein
MVKHQLTKGLSDEGLFSFLIFWLSFKASLVTNLPDPLVTLR